MFRLSDASHKDIDLREYEDEIFAYYSRKESQSVSELFYDRWTDTGGKSPFGERNIQKPKIKTVWKKSDEFSTVWREKCGTEDVIYING